jgi:hypothetical protein
MISLKNAFRLIKNLSENEVGFFLDKFNLIKFFLHETGTKGILEEISRHFMIKFIFVYFLFLVINQKQC